ncbi:MAG: helix-turn-helix domain-containing protein, partial [Methylococcales bacterium]
LQIPPLRERSGDIDRLVDHFMTGFSHKHRLEAPKFSKTAMDLLRSYSWPGNVRELRNLCERLLIILPGRILETSNIPYEIRAGRMKSERQSQFGFTLPESGIDMELLEIDLIHQALARTNGNRSKAARLLGMSRDTFLYRIHKYGIPG